MSLVVEFWKERERRLREVQAVREERRRRIRGMDREVKGWEVVGDVATELIRGFLQPTIDAWTKSMKHTS
jgi:hypothetical protein